jgi:hypothetical protein
MYSCKLVKLLSVLLVRSIKLSSSVIRFTFGVNGFAMERRIRRAVALTVAQGGHFSLSLSSTLPHLV